MRRVAAEAVHAVGADREAQLGEPLVHRGDLFGGRVERIHPGVELDELEAEIVGMLQRRVDRVAAERVELDAEVERAVIGRVGAVRAGHQGDGGKAATGRQETSTG